MKSLRLCGGSAATTATLATNGISIEPNLPVRGSSHPRWRPPADTLTRRLARDRESGGTENGAPGLRWYHPDNYPGYVLDPDGSNETQWNAWVSSAELRSDEPIGLGSRFGVVNGGASYDVTITTYDRPSRLVLEASGKPDLTITYTLRRTSDGTELESELDFRPRGSRKLLFSLLAPVIRRDVPKQYGSLKALRTLISRCSGDDGPGPGSVPE